jgi:general secretion pathway protein F
VYKYQALNNKGEFVEGELSLSSEERVVEELLKLNYVPIKVSSVKPEKTISLKLSRKDRFEVQQFFENLYDYLDSGLSIDKALELEARGMDHSSGQDMIVELLDQIRQGGSLSEAMKSQPEYFTSLHTGIVQVGEETDSLTESFQLLSSLISDLNEFKQKIKSALVYPMILTAVMFLSILILFGLVIPRFEALFVSMGIKMEGLTGFIVGISNVLTEQYQLLLIALLGIIMLMRNLAGRFKQDIKFTGFLLSLPMIGDMIKQYNLYLISRILSILLAKNITVLKSLEYVRDAIANLVYKKEIDSMALEINKGTAMNNVFSSSLFSQHFIYIVTIGAETGRLAESFSKLAKFYYKQLDVRIRALMVYVEPIIIMVLGLVVGMIVVTMLQAILSINELVV